MEMGGCLLRLDGKALEVFSVVHLLLSPGDQIVSTSLGWERIIRCTTKLGMGIWLPSQTEWEGLGGIFNSPPTVVSWGTNRLDIFGLGTDNQMYHKVWNDNRWLPSQTGWEALGGVFQSEVAALSWGPNRLDVFGLGTDNVMYHKFWTPGSGWGPSQTGWENLGGVFN